MDCRWVDEVVDSPVGGVLICQPGPMVDHDAFGLASEYTHHEAEVSGRPDFPSPALR